MDTYVEDKDVLFNEVFLHLAALQDPRTSAQLNEDLMRRAERALDASTPQNLLWRLLQTGEELLQALSQDPRPLTRVLERVVLLLPFDELRGFISAEKLEQGLQAPSVAVQLLVLAYFAKAADTPSGAGFIASSSSLVQRLVTTWLSVESTEVSERALESIIALLAVDNPQSTTVVAAGGRIGEAQGQGLMWRRMFHDQQVYSLMFLWTSLKTSNHDLKTKRGQQLVTIAQARLFDFLARTSQLDWAAITTSSLPDVEQQFTRGDATGQPYGGLLRYAASDMIDPSDLLMEVLRRDFFEKLLNIILEDSTQRVPPRLLEAIQHDAGVDPNAQHESVGVHL